MRETREDYIQRSEQKGGFLGNLSFSRIKPFIYIAAIGALAGTQFTKPNKRVIESIVGFVLVFTLWHFSTLGALWFLILMYPFPFGLSFGNSNLVLLMIIFIIYMIRVSAGLNKFRSDRLFNIPILLLLGAYLISWYNLEQTPLMVKTAFINTTNLFGAVIFFYLIYNFVDDEEKLRKTVKVAMITVSLVIGFTVIELLFPGRVLIPNWLYTQQKDRLIWKGIRVGGPFRDFELASEYFSLSAPIIFFMLIRSARLLTRSIYAILLVSDLFMMFATITRGGFIILVIGFMYMAFHCRKDLNFIRIISITAVFTLLIFVLESFVAQHTISGSLFDRLVMTTFERGVIPHNRFYTWTLNFNRMMEHPLIGHGPSWDFTKSIGTSHWPHNVYLHILNITGFLGFSVFILLLYGLFRSTLLGIKASIVSSPFPQALMKVLHVCLVMFLIDQLKIEFIRNNVYVYSIWLFFGLIAATRNVILKQEAEQTLPAPST